MKVKASDRIEPSFTQLPRTRDVLRNAQILTPEGDLGQTDETEALRAGGDEVPPDQSEELPRLKDDTEFVEYVTENLWDARRSKGIPWRYNVFKFISETYGPDAVAPRRNWIAEGMVQSDLIGLDDALYTALRVRLSRKDAIPAGWSFPTQFQANLDAITDPRERLKLEMLREAQRERLAAWRAKKAPRPEMQ